MEPSVHRELDWEGHVLPDTSPRCDGAKILEILAQPLVKRAPYALSLMLWIDPDIKPELLRMIHPWNMLTLSKPDRFLDLLAKTRVSFEMELRPVETLIFKPPLFRCPVVIGKDRAEDMSQLPVVISLEFADFQWECPLSRHNNTRRKSERLNLCNERSARSLGNLASFSSS